MSPTVPLPPDDRPPMTLEEVAAISPRTARAIERFVTRVALRLAREAMQAHAEQQEPSQSHDRPARAEGRQETPVPGGHAVRSEHAGRDATPTRPRRTHRRDADANDRSTRPWPTCRKSRSRRQPPGSA